jgi:hypothetical protein
MPLSLRDDCHPENLKLASALPLTRHPAAVYLSGLGFGSQRTIRYSLNRIAALLTNGECDAHTINTVRLRFVIANVLDKTTRIVAFQHLTSLSF